MAFEEFSCIRTLFDPYKVIPPSDVLLTPATLELAFAFVGLKVTPGAAITVSVTVAVAVLLPCACNVVDGSINPVNMRRIVIAIFVISEYLSFWFIIFSDLLNAKTMPRKIDPRCGNASSVIH